MSQPLPKNMKTKILLVIGLVSLLSASCNLFSKPTAGILKTSNGGVDWQASNKFKGDAKRSMVGLSISRMEFDPAGNDVLYAGAFNSGLYVSKDGGENWEELLGQIPVIDFAINPIDNQKIFVAGFYQDRARALATQNGGKSWNEIYSEAAGNSSARAIAINPADTNQILLGLSSGELILSQDSGATWRLVHNYNDRINRIIWRNEGVYVVVRGTGVFKSTDDANSFQQITATLRPVNGGIGFSIFGDNVSTYYQLSISPLNSNLMYVTTASGLFKSVDGGGTWTYVSMPLQQDDIAPSSVAIAPSSEDVVYVGSGSHIYKTVDGGSNWLATDTGTNELINALLVSPDLPTIAFAGVFIQ